MSDILESTPRKQRCNYLHALLSAVNHIPLLKEGIFIARATNDDKKWEEKGQGESANYY